ncbi:MAG: hypothetical protein KDA16_14390, partial [Phycisphaerales bacterium]|nr:hypothetical protein [Phycisphaerales bacterium]
MSQNSVSRGIAFAGDLHLSRAIYGGELPNMTGDSEFSLQQIVAHCRSEDLDLLLLGDNFDMRFPDGSLLASFLNAIQDVRVGF